MSGEETMADRKPTRGEAWDLLNAWTRNPSLIKHALAVEAAMRAMARRSGEDEDLWGIAGLIHDFDYERFADPPEHTREGAKELRRLGWPEEIVAAMLSHAEWNQDEYPLDTPLRRSLFAVDELCGFITACALVRPTGLAGMKPKSVTKKLKQPAFAAAVSRDDIRKGAELLEMELPALIAEVIEALQSIAGELEIGSTDQPGA
jgi:putative nucleotidyltransferase with HDIG domain